MHELRLLSYAKVNLTLDVSGLRPDGYHDIDSVVQVIGISDELLVTKTAPGMIEVEVESGDAPVGRDNIISRVAETFFAECGVSGGAKFVLRKRIPMQAGLGGGSGNAATAIAALSRLYGRGLSAEDVAGLAARVGSDAALFVYGGTVRMRGRGDRVEALPDAPELHLVVVKPEVGVSTAWAYAELDKRKDCSRVGSSERAESGVRAGDRDMLVAALSNDFDPVVSKCVPGVADAKRRLLDLGAQAVLLSGSGSAVFGVFGAEALALQVAGCLSGDFATAIACRTLTREESSLV